MTTDMRRALTAVVLVVIAAIASAGDSGQWLDVRTPEEYAAGHRAGAINVPHDELRARLPELGLDPTRPVFVYCGSGRRASIAREVLIDEGFRSVTNVRTLEAALAHP